MSFMQSHRLHERTILICCRHHPGFPADRRYHRKRPHMLLNNLPLYIIELIFLLRIAKRRHRMMEPMKPFSLRQILLIVPVIEKIIMQQRAPDQIMLVAMQPEFSVEKQTISRHIHTMIMHRHRAMLYMSPGAFKIRGVKNILTMFL